MKKILLSSAAVFAFAGAAAAEVNWSGAAEFGYNNDIEGGVYIDVDIDLSMSQELDNGWTAGVNFGFELADGGGGTLGQFTPDDDILIFVTSDMGGLRFGETEFAAVDVYSGVTNMAGDGFSEQDEEVVLRGDIVYGGITGAVSVAINDGRGRGTVQTGGAGAAGDAEQISAGLTGEFSGIGFSIGYQEASTYGGRSDTANDPSNPNNTGVAALNSDWNNDEIFAVAATAMFAGADFTLAWAQDSVENAIGIEASMPVGPGTVGAFYVFQTNDNYGIFGNYADGPFSIDAYFHGGGDQEIGIEGGYEVGMGVSLYAGYIDDSDFQLDSGAYIGAELDMGGGAKITASYADLNDVTEDEFGAREYMSGTSIYMTFKF